MSDVDEPAIPADPSEMPVNALPAHRVAAAKVREFPQSPGIYLMKDAAGRVIYVASGTTSACARQLFPAIQRISIFGCIGSMKFVTSISSNAKAKWTRY